MLMKHRVLRFLVVFGGGFFWIDGRFPQASALDSARKGGLKPLFGVRIRNYLVILG